MRHAVTIIVWTCMVCQSPLAPAQDAPSSTPIYGPAEAIPPTPGKIRSAPKLQPAADAEKTPWQPRLQVELETVVSASPQPIPDLGAFSTTSRPSRKPSPAILRLDDIQLTVTTSESSELRYSFTTKGPFELQLGSTRVSGASVSSVEGKLIATQASITTDGDAVFTAEKLELQIPITGVHIRQIPEIAPAESTNGFSSF